MNSFEKLIHVCKAYVDSALSMEDFQHEIEMIILPDVCKYTLEKEQHNAASRLEEIRFTILPENQSRYAIMVAEDLIHKVNALLN